MTYLLLSLENNGALCCVTDSLKDGCLACICPPYDKHSELDLWNPTTGLGVHWSDGGKQEDVDRFDPESSIDNPHDRVGSLSLFIEH